jgi:dihydrofolate reductase
MTRLLGLGRTLSNVDGRAFEKMANLIYGAITSLDGYVEDADGNFDWAEPDEEVHRFLNDLQSTFGTHLYGRRLYEVMTAWETMDSLPEAPPYIVDFARIWQAAEKIVYSSTLEKASTANTRIEREFEPGAVQRIKDYAATDLLVGGAALAAVALKAVLVDEIHLFVAPMVVGGGKRALPDRFRQKLELVDERRFDNGTVFLRCRIV